MTDPEGFLSRWARRKRDAVREESGNGPEVAQESATDTNDSGLPVEPLQARAAAETPDLPARDARSGEPAFDLSKLPSLDSITAETDIRPFFAAGVPASLRAAALRRVWVADPKIRDFIGIAENQFDFTGASEIPGFDFSSPGDVSRIVAQIFGGRSGDETPGAEAGRSEPALPNERTVAGGASPKLEPRSDPVPDAPPAESLPENSATAKPDSLSVRNADELQDSYAALHQDVAAQHDEPIRRRGRGSAMPR